MKEHWHITKELPVADGLRRFGEYLTLSEEKDAKETFATLRDSKPDGDKFRLSWCNNQDCVLLITT